MLALWMTGSGGAVHCALHKVTVVGAGQASVETVVAQAVWVTVTVPLNANALVDARIVAVAKPKEARIFLSVPSRKIK
jgi:acetolactate synthase regulatory subunit